MNKIKLLRNFSKKKYFIGERNILSKSEQNVITNTKEEDYENMQTSDWNTDPKYFTYLPSSINKNNKVKNFTEGFHEFSEPDAHQQNFLLLETLISEKDSEYSILSSASQKYGNDEEEETIILKNDTQIKIILNSGNPNIFWQKTVKVFPKLYLKPIIPSLTVKNDEFDRMMSQYDFLMTYRGILCLKSFSPIEMYLSLEDSKIRENRVANSIFSCLLKRWIICSKMAYHNFLGKFF